jgi:hypothetical protein
MRSPAGADGGSCSARRVIGIGPVLMPVSDHSQNAAKTRRFLKRTTLPARQRPGELAYRLLMLLVSDLGNVAGDLEHHALVRHDLPRTFFSDTFVKIGDRRAQRAGDLKQSSGGDAIDAALVFMSCCWVSPSIMRRSRIRPPTWWSIPAVERPLFGFAMLFTV